MENDSDPELDETHEYRAIDRPEPEFTRERLGRYVIRGRLGAGGFAEVFLAYDEDLDRQVALKVPRTDRFSELELQRFSDEARTAARLQHPGIVSVYDVGEDNGVQYIVLEYIRGRQLLHLIEHDELSFTQIGGLLTQIANALSHAHQCGFVHRDIKPQNILLDSDDRPFVTDFGLAVSQRDLEIPADYLAGTPHYMAPEQVRGENHRIDCRTDIWALGVILYRMLTGTLPFTGPGSHEVFQSILHTEPSPLIELKPSIPVELNRICMKCLSRQMSGRYRTADELALELTQWIGFETGEAFDSSLRRAVMPISPADAPVIPRGLRAFDQDDIDFFLKLVPGPRDRDGLPASVRFWKKQFERRDPEATLRIGVLYGPSGCGKSSLVKAGILPRLNRDVDPIYIDTTSDETESTLRRILGRKCDLAGQSTGLANLVRIVRKTSEHQALPKTLIVLDQFEQWLNSWSSDADAELVQALRQCDGANVQCLLLVRDDFWLPLSRFMGELEIRIVDGENSMLVDSFDPSHAENVLTEFGVAYGRLTGSRKDQSEEQRHFVQLAVEQLCEDNRLYPVRLAAFVEMTKARTWSPEVLEEMGGAAGVGVAFLEKSFGRGAGPAHRLHETAARNVLSTLLPEAGSIKENARKRSELLNASGYQDSETRFDELLQLLDVELRLLTRVAPADEPDPLQNIDAQTLQVEDRYQLTHDFLVPSIREWIEGRLRGTRRGRAQLMLEEQADAWKRRPSDRYLPTLAEWLQLIYYTEHSRWNETQQSMMNAARRRIGRRLTHIGVVFCALCGVLLLVFSTFVRRQREVEAERLFNLAQSVEISDLNEVVAGMDDYRDLMNPMLKNAFRQDAKDHAIRMRLGIALLPDDQSMMGWLTEQLISVRTNPEEFLVLCQALRQVAAPVTADLQGRLHKSETSRVRFRILCALAQLSSNSVDWTEHRGELASSFLREPSTDALTWIKAMTPVRSHVTRALLEAIPGASHLESARMRAIAVRRLGDNAASGLMQLLLKGDLIHARAATDLLRDLPNVSDTLQKHLHDLRALTSDDADRQTRIANLVITLRQLNHRADFDEMTQFSEEPQLRTRIIHSLKPTRIDSQELLSWLCDPATDAATHNTLLHSIYWHVSELDEFQQTELLEHLNDVVRNDPNSGNHAMAEFLLRQAATPKWSAVPLEESSPIDAKLPAQWRINAAGQTMIRIVPPAAGESLDALNHQFEISATEVTWKQLGEFAQDNRNNEVDLPATGLLMTTVVDYCNHLSELDGIPPQEWCYPDVERNQRGFELCHPVDDFLQKQGYRLPTATEWQFACSCGTTTSRFYGDEESLLPVYAWLRVNSGGVIRPVGQRLPNPFGLFDTYGNVAEICIDTRDPANITYSQYGMNAYSMLNAVTSTERQEFNLRVRGNLIGFRIVRTVLP